MLLAVLTREHGQTVWSNRESNQYLLLTKYRRQALKTLYLMTSFQYFIFNASIRR